MMMMTTTTTTKMMVISFVLLRFYCFADDKVYTIQNYGK